MLLPETLRCVVSPQSGRVRIMERSMPAIGVGEALLRMEYCGLCGSDVAKVETPGRTQPVVLGHEVVGRVAAVGADVKLEIGAAVALAHHVPDPASHYTQRGSGPMDPHFKASNLDPGGFATWIRAPAEHVQQTLLPLPADFPLLRGVFVEPLACCLRALDRVLLHEGDCALLIGVGAAGLLFAPLLRDRSVTLFAADVRAERLEMACAWGAVRGLLAGQDDLSSEVRQATAGRGADIVILTVVTPQSWATVTAALRDGGTLLLFGVKPGVHIDVDLHALWRREINLISSYSATPDLLPRALALLRRPGWALESTISHCLPLEEAPAAFDLARAGKASKIVLCGA